jgi:aldehyde:ferredoxin oxidoreductase
MLGYEEMAGISALVDELGMDSEEVGGLVAWSMDLYEHGIITREDLGGIDLKGVTPGRPASFSRR